MRKRISQAKDAKPVFDQRNQQSSKKEKNRCHPLRTLNLLHEKTSCLQQVRQFEKGRIDKIVMGDSIESVKFMEIQKNCCYQEYLRKCYKFKEITQIFTDVITKNSLSQNLIFMDFKLKNYKVMNNYAHQLKQFNSCKSKNDTNLTASHSSTKEGKYFKEMEHGIKKITKRRPNDSRKRNNNASASFINMLAKNIEKMIKNIKDSSIIFTKEDFKPILNSKQLNLPDISNIYQERLHTSPESMPFDSYGLDEFKQKNEKKNIQISQLAKSTNRDRLKKEKSKDMFRYQTQYDTQYISDKKSKSKILPTSRSKASFSKNKSLLKVKSSSLLKGLKLKK